MAVVGLVRHYSKARYFYATVVVTFIPRIDNKYVFNN